MAVMDLIFGDMHYTLGFGPHNGFLGIAGNLCGPNTLKLGPAFRKAAQHLKGRLFVSFDGLKSLDTGAMTFFLQQKKVLDDLHCEVVLVDVPANILLLLDGAQLTSVFEIVATRQEAEAKYGYAYN
jgi:anti-anti-sigma regulatory factor